MSYNFFVHTDLTFGKDAIEALPEIIEAEGIKKVLVIYDAGVKAAGIAQKVLQEMNKVKGLTVSVFDGVEPNPSNGLIEKIYGIAKAEEVQGFVAIGGGSSIDSAKAVNVLMTNEGPIGQYGGIGLVKENVLPLIAIPTTAGTSSEITNVTALTDTEAVCKYVVIDNKITPTHVIADPEFTRTMPKSVTAATGMDAITHAVESYISNMSNPLTKYNSIEGLKIFHKYLQRAVENGEDMEAREQMMLGCIITGFGFSNANLGFVHGIAHTLSAHFGLPHGMANACVLPYVIAFNAPSCKKEMIELAQAIDLPLTGNEDEDILALSKELLNMTKALGIKTLSEQGIKESDFDMLAEDVLKEPVLGFNPRQGITKEDIINILKQAF
ncbi:iron-containing alcohol dehydrogenase family protein [Pseudobutyrivibrio sp.]|uniref:iron-containing alcohol dehydrogenase family protein n=1 Tax=Pseudobutyrivibrio sp. TaxID=2014367 RepID=UPI001DEC679E|nr:iron-containing alcohol dehydrogenase [Pseudobutyrivibrio sp.]MBE5911159.1 iron-containing alcohol dehydrogenase [Pseudobutyrivibrio sp.]